MAFGSLLLFSALLIVVALIIARPLVENRSEDSGLDETSSHWLAERERVLDALAELDADRQLGKVPKDIYASQRKQLVARGAMALREIEKADKYTSKQVYKGKQNSGRAPLDELENLIAEYKARRKGHK